VQNKFVQLNWQTASGTTNDHFEVERSTGNAGWEPVANIKAAVNSNHIVNYAATDRHPYPGNSYYRLKQVDIDGTIRYTAIQKININEPSLQLHVYPNPAGKYLVITGNITSGNIASINDFSVFDQYGRNISSRIGKSSYEQSQGLRIDVSRLLPGVYFIKTQSGSSKFYKN
jgi:hypothetical protein